MAVTLQPPRSPSYSPPIFARLLHRWGEAFQHERIAATPTAREPPAVPLASDTTSRTAADRDSRSFALGRGRGGLKRREDAGQNPGRARWTTRYRYIHRNDI